MNTAESEPEPETLRILSQLPRFKFIQKTEYKEDPRSFPEFQMASPSAQELTGSFSSWQQTSSLLRYVNPELIQQIAAYRVACPPWMTTDLRVNGTPVLCHGTFKGQKVVESGLPLPSLKQGGSSVINIINLNAFTWLTETSEESGNQKLVSESRLDHGDVVVKTSSAQVAKADAGDKELIDAQKNYTWTRPIIIFLLIILLLDLVYSLITKQVFARKSKVKAAT